MRRSASLRFIASLVQCRSLCPHPMVPPALHLESSITSACVLVSLTCLTLEVPSCCSAPPESKLQQRRNSRVSSERRRGFSSSP